MTPSARASTAARRDRASRPTRPIRIKHARDARVRGDGFRVLIDRLWPRGLAKAHADFDEWCQDVAPTRALRTFYGHDPNRLAEFRRRYEAELRGTEASAGVEHLVGIARRRPLTLLTATHDLAASHATVLARHLERVAGRSRRARAARRGPR